MNNVLYINLPKNLFKDFFIIPKSLNMDFVLRAEYGYSAYVIDDMTYLDYGGWSEVNWAENPVVFTGGNQDNVYGHTFRSYYHLSFNTEVDKDNYSGSVRYSWRDIDDDFDSVPDDKLIPYMDFVVWVKNHFVSKTDDKKNIIDLRKVDERFGCIHHLIKNLNYNINFGLHKDETIYLSFDDNLGCEKVIVCICSKFNQQIKDTLNLNFPELVVELT